MGVISKFTMNCLRGDGTVGVMIRASWNSYIMSSSRRRRGKEEGGSWKWTSRLREERKRSKFGHL